MKQYQASHSFTRRPVSTQIIAYLLLITQLLVFSTCLQNNITNPTLRLTLILLYYLSYSGLVIAWIVASCTDPSDKLTRGEKGSEAEKSETKFRLFCQICKSAVNGDTRHCKVCNICVVGFDHHCVWINNCIGSNNYVSFIAMIFLVVLNFISFLYGVLTVWLERNWQTFLLAMVINWILAFVVFVFTLLVTALLIFHIYLKCIGKTTYQYLLIKSKEKATIVPVSHEPHEVSEHSLEPSKSNMKMNSQYHFGSFQTEVVPKLREASDSHANDRISVIFSDKNSQKSRKSESQKHLSIRPQQVVQNHVLQVDSNKGEQKSEKETNGDAYLKRNKSLDYIFGKIQYNQPQKINYQSTFNPGKRLQKEAVVKLRESKHH